MRGRIVAVSAEAAQSEGVGRSASFDIRAAILGRRWKDWKTKPIAQLRHNAASLAGSREIVPREAINPAGRAVQQTNDVKQGALFRNRTRL